jgi:hypothetical protein
MNIPSDYASLRRCHVTVALIVKEMPLRKCRSGSSFSSTSDLFNMLTVASEKGSRVDLKHVRLQILIAASMQFAIFWDVELCITEEVY